MKIPAAITDYVAMISGDLDLDDPAAVAAHNRALTAAKERATNPNLAFEERLQAKLEVARIEADDTITNQRERRQQRITDGFIKAASASRFASLTARDWEDLGVPKDVAKAVTEGRSGAATTKVTKTAVADWVATQQVFTRKGALAALSCSPNTLKAGIQIAIDRGIQIAQDGSTWTVKAA